MLTRPYRTRSEVSPADLARSHRTRLHGPRVEVDRVDGGGSEEARLNDPGGKYAH
jgi:hypothetical protein